MSMIERPATAFSLDPSKGRKRKRERAEGHLDFIRKLPCVCCGRQPAEAAHIRFGDPRYGKRSTGMAEKPSDQFAVPLCAEEHRGPKGQHSMNEREFWKAKGIDPLAIATRLWACSGDVEAGEMIIAYAREEAA